MTTATPAPMLAEATAAQPTTAPMPMLMHGHPDDTPGGYLVMSEYDVHMRKQQKEKRKAVRAGDGDDTGL